MNVEEEKIKYVKAILETQDEALLAKIGHLLKSEQVQDAFEVLTEAQKASIEKGLQEAKDGKVISWDEVKKKLQH